MDLAAELRELRTHAGSPSVREIERLIARQGRNRPMARSTIQEKLSGRSPVNLTQVLSIVEALGEYARLNDAPLPPEKIDQAVWRDRVVGSVAKLAARVDVVTYSVAPQGNRLEFNRESLRQAEMFDVLLILDASHGKHLAGWLPRVLREMLNAGMKITDYLEVAAQDEPRGIVALAAALEEEFPPRESSGWGEDPWNPQENTLTVLELLKLTARGRGADASPAIVAGLRRAELGQHVNHYLTAVGSWHLARNIEKAVDHLRSAALPADANRLLSLVGSERRSDRLSEVVKHFQVKEKIEDRNLILRGAGKGDKYRFRAVVSDLKKDSAPVEVLTQVAHGVPYGQHAEYEQHLREAGLEDMAELVLKAGESPF